VPIFHLVTEGEAVHRLYEDFGDQQIDVLPAGHFQRLLSGMGREDFIARGLLQDLDSPLQILALIDDHDSHADVLTCPVAPGAADRS
jgi:hypothetical protein